MPSLNKMRIGVFGGAFAPPHRGHEKASLAFLEKASLDLLYVIPSGIPPHKTISSGATDEDRLEMARLAFSPLSEKIRVSDMEILAKGTCYSYLTLEKIAETHPESEICLFVGTDQFLVFETWRNFEHILKNVTLCVMDRYEDTEALLRKKESLEKDFGARVLLLEEKPYIISSSEIRCEIEKYGFSEALSPAVNEYISLRGIYSSLSDPLRRELLERGKRSISEKRFLHTLSVEREVVRLGKLFSLSETDLREMALAALYHDLAKEWSIEESILFLARNGFGVSKSDEPLLHGFVASVFAKEDGHISKDAFVAVRFHTTGRSDMSLKEKILYFADYIEEKRENASCKKVRRFFYENLPEGEKERLGHLDTCILMAMEHTENYLRKKNIPVHPLGIVAREDLENRKESI